jgi:uncharacterized protein YfdQ (DUF2303 family)
MTQENNTQAAIEAGRATADAIDKLFFVRQTKHEDGETEVPVVVLQGENGGEKTVILKDALELADSRAERPRARRGTAVLTDVDSFIAHAERFKDEHSAIFADRSGVKLQAVYDYHDDGGKARWGKHRAAYACPLSRQWKLWLGRNEQPMNQADFGQFIEDNLSDLAAGEGFPAPADVLLMARKLVVHTKGTFERSINVTTGESSLVNKVENEATSTKIPKAFLLGIPVFEMGEAFKVEARLRFFMQDGGPRFAFSLYQHQAVLEIAFGEVCEKVRKGTSMPLFYGAPEL